MTAEEQTKPVATPPDSLHEMLGMAIEDFRKVLKDPLYRVKMNVWYVKEDDICYVCLGGAFLSQRMKPKGLRINWDSISIEWSNALEALNLIRQGCVGQALRRYYCYSKSPGKGHDPFLLVTLAKRLETEEGHPLADRDVAFDSTDPEPFLNYLDEVHLHLKEAGL